MWTFENWKELNDRLQTDGRFYPQFIAEGSAILRAHEQNVQSVVRDGGRLCTITFITSPSQGWLPHRAFRAGLAANCPPHLASDVGHELATESGAYGLCWHVDEKNMVKCSLRSNGDYDVSEIAKAFGGGGHRNAAGFEVTIETLLGWIR